MPVASSYDICNAGGGLSKVSKIDERLLLFARDVRRRQLRLVTDDRLDLLIVSQCSSAIV